MQQSQEQLPIKPRHGAKSARSGNHPRNLPFREGPSANISAAELADQWDDNDSA